MSFLVPVGGCSIGACLPGCEYLHPRPSIAHPAPLCSAPQIPVLPVFEKRRLSSRCTSDPVPSVQSGSATDGRDLIHVSVRFVDREDMAALERNGACLSKKGTWRGFPPRS